MSATPSSANSSSNPDAGSGPYQDRLVDFCRSRGVRSPTFQVISDRRGGRTAWSCTIDIQGTPVQARFWYDGQYVNQAREDAAQVALERLGQIPRSGVNPTQQLQQSYQGTQNGDQQRSYTVNQR